MVAYMPSISLVSQLVQTGEMHVNTLSNEMLTLCVDGCNQSECSSAAYAQKFWSSIKQRLIRAKFHCFLVH
eukprot:SAG31_NODE_7916_length_1565_cov_1.127558_3_plen_70_part_01